MVGNIIRLLANLQMSKIFSDTYFLSSANFYIAAISVITLVADFFYVAEAEAL